MNCLHLTGYGIKLKVSKLKAKSQLEITNGRDSIKDNQTNYVFSPRKIPYDTIIIDGYSGYVSLFKHSIGYPKIIFQFLF